MLLVSCTPQGKRLMGTGYFIKRFTSLLRIWGCNCVCCLLLFCVAGRIRKACSLETEGSTPRSHEESKNTIQERQTSEEKTRKIIQDKDSFFEDIHLLFMSHELTLTLTHPPNVRHSSNKQYESVTKIMFIFIIVCSTLKWCGLLQKKTQIYCI